MQTAGSGGSQTNPLRSNNSSPPFLVPPSARPDSTPEAPAYQMVPDDYHSPPPSVPPGIFQQIQPRSNAASLPSSSSSAEIVRGVPSPAAAYPNSANPPDENSECGPNYSGALGKQHEFQPLPGSGVPSMFQPEHYPRAMGFGEPLQGTSWQNRPFHVDFFAGDMIGDDAVDHVIGQEAGFFTGGRVGWDYDYYWGVETRLGVSWMSLFDSQRPTTRLGVGNIIVWDMSLLYYPWGDSRWRPFLLLGTGIQQLDAYGSSPRIYQGTLFELPFGAGLKYRFNEWMIFRVDVIDNLAFGDGSLDTMHNVSFSGGVEYHFGGHRRSYWPWNPNPKH